MENNLTIIDQAKKGLAEITNLKAEIDKIGLNCQQIEIRDEVTLAVAQQNLSKANNMLTLIESKYRDIKSPYWEACKLCDNTKKLLTEQLNKGIGHIKLGVGNWEKKRLEEEAKKKAEIQKQLEVNQITPEAAQEQVQKIQEISSVSATKNIRKSWAFELVDITKVPLEWLTLDEDKVKEYMRDRKDELKEDEVVNGVKFFKKISVVS